MIHLLLCFESFFFFALFLVFLCKMAGGCPFTINLEYLWGGQSGLHQQKQQNMSPFALFLSIVVFKMTSLTVCWWITPFLVNSTLSGHNLEDRGNGYNEWGVILFLIASDGHLCATCGHLTVHLQAWTSRGTVSGLVPCVPPGNILAQENNISVSVSTGK